MKVKKIAFYLCFVLSCLLLVTFLTVFVLFLVQTSKTAPSFALAAKNVLLFLSSISYTVAFLAFGIAFAGVSIKLSPNERMRTNAKRLFVAEMVLFFAAAGVTATMYVVV